MECSCVPMGILGTLISGAVCCTLKFKIIHLTISLVVAKFVTKSVQTNLTFCNVLEGQYQGSNKKKVEVHVLYDGYLPSEHASFTMFYLLVAVTHFKIISDNLLNYQMSFTHFTHKQIHVLLLCTTVFTTYITYKQKYFFYVQLP